MLKCKVVRYRKKDTNKTYFLSCVKLWATMNSILNTAVCGVWYISYSLKLTRTQNVALDLT